LLRILSNSFLVVQTVCSAPADHLGVSFAELAHMKVVLRRCGDGCVRPDPELRVTPTLSVKNISHLALSLAYKVVCSLALQLFSQLIEDVSVLGLLSGRRQGKRRC